MTVSNRVSFSAFTGTRGLEISQESQQRAENESLASQPLANKARTLTPGCDDERGTCSPVQLSVLV